MNTLNTTNKETRGRPKVAKRKKYVAFFISEENKKAIEKIKKQYNIKNNDTAISFIISHFRPTE